MASYPETDSRSTLTFAEPAAAAEFGRNYVQPWNRDFVDHEPRWQKLGDVADGVGDRLRRQRDHDDQHLENVVQADIAVEHDMVEV